MYLNCHTSYSLRYGTLSVRDLVQQARSCGVHTLALTDINNTTGCIEFVKACHEHGIRPVAGAEVRNGDRLMYVCLAHNNEGFREINDFITAHHFSGEPFPDKAPRFNHAFVVYPWHENMEMTYLGDNEFAGLRMQQLFRARYSSVYGKSVLLYPVTYGHGHYELHRRLRAIDHNILLTQLHPSMMAAPDACMMPLPRLREMVGDHKLMSRTESLLDSCSIAFDFTTVKNRKHFTGNARDDRMLLDKLAKEGMRRRYGDNHRVALQRVKKELEIIDALHFASYFLIVWDIIRYSVSCGFYHVGRGSGANSLVAYCLGITEVCPIELDLYFERFLNPKRKTPPDFDIDYSWKERDKVIEYIFHRYGSRHTALLGTIVTFRDRAVTRELGKVYGLPPDEIDAIIAGKRNNARIDDAVVQEIRSFETSVRDMPNMRSIHAGGILISEEPVTSYVALDMPPKGFPTVQFDMYVAEEIGFEKIDILSQRGIGHIRDAVSIILENRRERIDIHDTQRFKNDGKVREQLRSAQTVGCFYIESPAMRGLLRKLHCEHYVALVAASSIIRPGVARSGMMREYIRRSNHPEEVTYLHPVLQEQLKETFGVMVFQEDVLKVGHHFGGLDLADADVLRRMMSGKGRTQKSLQEIENKFFTHCRRSGYADDIAREVWRQIESFAGYSFSKAHSASYAVESYQSLFLKAHYPLEFMVAVINNFGGFYRTWVYVQEAVRCGATVHLPCVNRSRTETCLYGKDVFLGFVHVENLEQAMVSRIISERNDNGPFFDMEDFVRRVRPGLQQLLLLVRLQAFRFAGKPKKQLMWHAHILMNGAMAVAGGAALFHCENERTHDVLPPCSDHPVEDAYDEMELLGFPVTMHMFDLLKTSFRGEVMSDRLILHSGKKVRMMGRYVASKYIRTAQGKTMAFGTFLDAEGGFFDTVHFPESLQGYPFKGGGIYLILGRVAEEFGFPSLEVEKMAKLGVVPDPRGDR